jgi:release factor glutamine methyltransferase
MALALKTTRERILAEPDRPLTPDASQRFDALVSRRAAGWPLAYLSGRREFWSLDFHVTRATLVPRPETEALVAAVCTLIPAGSSGRLLDLGTGSGAIAVALAHERPCLEIWATDLDLEVLRIARANARRLGRCPIRFRAGAWFEALPRSLTFDAVVSNPPYLAATDPHLAGDGLRFEPRRSLVAGPTGLEALFDIIREAPSRLSADGFLALEHAPAQRAAVHAAFQAGGWVRVRSYTDIGGQIQGSVGFRPGTVSRGS